MEKFECERTLEVLCNICGLYTPKNPKAKRCSITDLVEANYHKKFQRQILKDASYAPKIVCLDCNSALNESRYHRNLPISPMIWNTPNEEHSNCYACLIPCLIGKRSKDRKKIKYPEYPETNSKRPLWPSMQEQERERSPQPAPSIANNLSPQPGSSRSTDAQGPVDLPQIISDVSVISVMSLVSSVQPLSSGEVYQLPSSATDKHPILMSQADFNDHCRDMNFTVTEAELEGSRLAERNFLEKGVETTLYRRDDRFSSKFKTSEITLTIKKPIANADRERHSEDSEEEAEQSEISVTYDIAYVSDLEGLFNLFGTEHKTDEWRLFLDGSSKSLKVVLLHNENTLPSIPIAYCKGLPEKYESMQYILNLIQYEKYQWDVIVDFKLINILVGLMGAASKHPCVYCLWDSKYKKSDKYTKTDWPARPQWSEATAGKYNAIKPPLVPASKILMPPLHIKIGLVTQLFKKIFQKNSAVRNVLHNIFPTLSQAKMKAGVYDGPQIRKIFENKDLPKALKTEEYHAFSCLKEVSENFLGNERAPNYRQLIKDMMKSYEKLDINITIKMHSLICHLDLFKNSCGAFSDEQGERFHQDLKTNEDEYAGKNMARALGRYCWKLIRETDPNIHKRQSNYNKKMKAFYVYKN